MRLKILSAFILLFLTVTTLGQTVNLEVKWKPLKNHTGSDTIFYDVKRKLTWNDFQAEPQPEHFAGAITSSGFGYHSYSESNGKTVHVSVEIYVYFNKNRSWKKEKIHSDYHLVHEQRHFDITRLGAQIFYEQLKNAHLTGKNYKSMIPHLFDEAYKKSNALQNQYDRETNHSMDIEKQMEWNERIEKRVLALPKG